MVKKELIRTFVDEIFSKPSRKDYPTNKLIYNHIDETWSSDLADMIDYKISVNKSYRYIFAIKENSTKYL